VFELRCIVAFIRRLDCIQEMSICENRKNGKWGTAKFCLVVGIFLGLGIAGWGSAIGIFNHKGMSWKEVPSTKPNTKEYKILNHDGSDATAGDLMPLFLTIIPATLSLMIGIWFAACVPCCCGVACGDGEEDGDAVLPIMAAAAPPQPWATAYDAPGVQPFLPGQLNPGQQLQQGGTGVAWQQEQLKPNTEMTYEEPTGIKI